MKTTPAHPPAAVRRIALGLVALSLLACQAAKGPGSGSGNTIPGPGPVPASGDPLPDTPRRPGPVATLTSDGTTSVPGYAAVGTVSPGVGGDAVSSASLSLNGGAPAPLTLTGGRFSVPVVLRPGNNVLEITATDALNNTLVDAFPVFFQTGLPTSTALIAAALQAGTITAEQALAYRVYAAFSDPRLPTQYQGDATQDDLRGVLGELAAAVPTLSEAAKDDLGPFLAPPIYQTAPAAAMSAQAARRRALLLTAFPCNPLRRPSCPIDSSWTSTAGREFRVWYPQANAGADLPKARVILDTMEGAVDAAAKLKALMGNGPIPDGGGIFDGGDALLDIVLVPSLANGAPAATLPSSWSATSKSSVFILVAEDQGPNKLAANVVHEYMHALQWARGLARPGLVLSYRTLAESTAQWAIHYVLAPYGNHLAREANVHAFKNMRRGLLYGSEDQTSDLAYGAWLFILYLERAVAYHPVVVRQLWDAAANANERNAIKEVVDGYKNGSLDLAYRWADFTRVLWNRALADELVRWGAAGPADGADSNQSGLSPDVDLKGQGQHFFAMPSDLPPLSAIHDHFYFPYREARSVFFLDGLRQKLSLTTTNQPGMTGMTAVTGDPIAYDLAAGVQVFVKVGGKWANKPITIASQGWITGAFWCRDFQAERLEEMVVILSNSSPEWGHQIAPADLASNLLVTNLGCQGWTGTATVYSGAPVGVTESTEFALNWQRTVGDTANFRVRDGTVNWSIGGDDGRCSYSGNASWPATQDTSQIYFFPLHVAGPLHRAFTGGLSTASQPVSYQKTCRPPYENQSGIVTRTGGLGGYFPVEGGGDPMATVGPDGSALGTYDATAFDNFKLRWSLTATSEP
jgi:hypothetical protein